MYYFWKLLSDGLFKVYSFTESKRLHGLEKELDWLGINDLFIDDDEI